MVNLLADAFPTNELYLDARNTLSRLLGGIDLPEPEAVAASQRAGR
jgi:hypothetical protein